ncbi:acetyl Co-enzyme a carboxylase biotin carboxylase subunit [Prunus dulcis]|uniref:Acetyl Co-enzyme a carboxylase biotin carboxylase subunit n=1 Tax=Prunus dulcis TaxID=3755 RepID=A0A4Y1RXJ8_PRUDU|nr:acetyl Co-enzyme a carboxylase biotin carboxylase subunit [Prunus dulcis]
MASSFTGEITIDFSEMEDCPVSSGNVLLGTKLLTFSLNSVLRGDVPTKRRYNFFVGDRDDNGIPTPDSTH